MSDPRGGAGGPATEVGPAHRDPGTSTDETSVDVDAPAAAENRPEGTGSLDDEASEPAAPMPPVDAQQDEAPLDAAAHAHVLLDPLPPPDDEPDTPLFREMSVTGDRSPTLVLPPAPDGEPDPSPTPSSEAPSANRTSEPTSVRHAHVDAARTPLRRRRGVRIAVRSTVGLALLAASGLAAYLYVSATAWRDNADSYLEQAGDLGEDLSRTRGDLVGAQAELDAVREQLATAHQRITELASEKAQLSDDWEITQQLVDYQERVSDAAGQVALALDQCVQSQQQLIGYLARAAEQNTETTSTPAPYDPAQLAQFESDVEAFCQDASEANIALQQELAR